MSFPVHEAARDGKSLVVEGLLSENNKIAITQDDDGRIPLHWSVANGDLNMTKIILNYMNNIDLDDFIDNSGWTPLHIAASIGNSDILDALMTRSPKPDVNLATNSGTTMLHLAVSKNHVDVVNKLINEYHVKTTTKDKRGITALQRAAANGNCLLIKKLLQAKAFINSSDNDGWTALHHALAEGHGDAGILLVNLGADVSKVDKNDETAIAVAPEPVAKYFTERIK